MRQARFILSMLLIAAAVPRLARAGANDSPVETIPTTPLKADPPPRHILTIAAINLELIRIPAGQYLVGSPKSEHERYTDEPTPTAVNITKDYWLGKTDVTQGQWQALMGNNPSKYILAGLSAPVEQVSWDDAMVFCEKLTAQERVAGRLPDGYIYTLPTETQWECACRAGTTTPYAGNLDDMAWYASNGGISTHPVAQKQPNAWGFYDMHGNVWEWTSTWYSTSMLGRSGGKDPAGPTIGKLRVLRGGSFEMPAVPARSSYRFHLPPETRKGSIGFRVALTAPSVPEVPQPGLGRRRGGRGAQSQPLTTQRIETQQQPIDQNVLPVDPNLNQDDQAPATPVPGTTPGAN